MSGPSQSTPEPVRVRGYLAVFVALACLTLVTVGVSTLHLKKPLAIALGLTIALIKGGLVAGVFMHLVSEKKVVYAILALTAVLFLCVLLLPVMTSPGGLGPR